MTGWLIAGLVLAGWMFLGFLVAPIIGRLMHHISKDLPYPKDPRHP